MSERGARNTMKTRRWTSTLAGAVVVLMASSAALAANNALIAIARIDDYLYPTQQFSLEIELELDVAGITGVAVTAVGGPVLLEQDGVYWNSDDIQFEDLAAMKAALDGQWTIVITGSSPSISTFTLDAASLSDADFYDTATDLSPANGETGVGVNAEFSWTDPTGDVPPYVLVVGTEDEFDNDQEAVSFEGQIELDATAWQPPLPLQNGFNEFWVFYTDVGDASFVTPLSVSSGTIVWSDHALAPPGYPAAAPLLALASETIVGFTVPEPAPGLAGAAALGTLALVAHCRRRRG